MKLALIFLTYFYLLAAFAEPTVNSIFLPAAGTIVPLYTGRSGQKITYTYWNSILTAYNEKGVVRWSKTIDSGDNSALSGGFDFNNDGIIDALIASCTFTGTTWGTNISPTGAPRDNRVCNTKLTFVSGNNGTTYVPMNPLQDKLWTFATDAYPTRQYVSASVLFGENTSKISVQPQYATAGTFLDFNQTFFSPGAYYYPSSSSFDYYSKRVMQYPAQSWTDYSHVANGLIFKDNQGQDRLLFFTSGRVVQYSVGQLSQNQLLADHPYLPDPNRTYVAGRNYGVLARDPGDNDLFVLISGTGNYTLFLDFINNTMAKGEGSHTDIYGGIERHITLYNYQSNTLNSHFYSYAHDPNNTNQYYYENRIAYPTNPFIRTTYGASRYAYNEYKLGHWYVHITKPGSITDLYVLKDMYLWDIKKIDSYMRDVLVMSPMRYQGEPDVPGYYYPKWHTSFYYWNESNLSLVMLDSIQGAIPYLSSTFRTGSVTNGSGDGGLYPILIGKDSAGQEAIAFYHSNKIVQYVRFPGYICASCPFVNQNNNGNGSSTGINVNNTAIKLPSIRKSGPTLLPLIPIKENDLKLDQEKSVIAKFANFLKSAPKILTNMSSSKSSNKSSNKTMTTGPINSVTTTFLANSSYSQFALNRLAEMMNPAKNYYQMIDSAYVAYPDNTYAYLSWSEVFVLDGYLRFYEGTKNPEHLEKFLTHAELILSKRDDRTGHKDYLGRAGPVWSSIHYTQGVPYSGIVSSGMFTYPLAKFANIVKKYSLGPRFSRLNKTYQVHANNFITAAKQTVDFHDEEINHQPKSCGLNTIGCLSYLFPLNTCSFFVDTGHDPACDHEAVPYNMQNALARTMIMIYAVTGEQKYLQKARGIAAYYKKALKPQADGSVLVDYWIKNNSQEDLSHGSMSVDFMKLAHDEGVAFTTDDLHRFALTMMNRMKLSPTTISLGISGGQEIASDSDLITMPNWIVVSGTKPEMKQLAHDVLASKPSTISGAEFNAYGVLAEYGGVKAYGSLCSSDSECSSNICFAGQVCGKPLGNGSTCSRNRECHSGICFNQQVCANQLGVGSTCYAHHECLSSKCSGNKCVGTKIPGSVCATNLECESGQCFLGMCKTKLGNGSTCRADRECTSNICFAGKICASLLGNGSTCGRDNECLSGTCFGGMVCANKLGINSTCYRDHECTNNLICHSAHKCLPRVGKGSTCYRNNECTSNRCEYKLCL